MPDLGMDADRAPSARLVRTPRRSDDLPESEVLRRDVPIYGIEWGLAMRASRQPCNQHQRQAGWDA